MKLIQAFVCAVTLLGGGMILSAASADNCVNCSSGSSNGCQQCRLNDPKEGNKDTQAARKKCEERGCKITGTGSCSTAANVKVCSIADVKSPTEVVAWMTVSSVN